MIQTVTVVYLLILKGNNIGGKFYCNSIIVDDSITRTKYLKKIVFDIKYTYIYGRYNLRIMNIIFLNKKYSHAGEIHE